MKLYYVINIGTPEVVTDIQKDFLSYIVSKSHIITITSFGQYNTLKEARAARKANGGIILTGVK